MNLIFIVSKMQEHSNGHWMNISALSALVLAGWGLRKMRKKGLFSLALFEKFKAKSKFNVHSEFAIWVVYGILLGFTALFYLGWIWLTGSILASILLALATIVVVAFSLLLLFHTC